MLRIALTPMLALGLLFMTSCSSVPATSTANSAAVNDLAPTGKLRAAINFGNPVLAAKDPASGEARGVSVDLSRELAHRLGVSLEMVTFTAAGKVVEAVKSGAWDIAFVAIDAARASDMDYTAPYVVIEGAYLVPNASTIMSNDQVDRDGIRVVVGAGSAYDLYLSRELKRAQIIRAPTSAEVVQTMVAQGRDVAAGVKQQLQADAARVPGVRLLPGRFMVINQAMATPKGRSAGAHYLDEFIEAMKASGFVADSLARHGIEGAMVAPPGR